MTSLGDTLPDDPATLKAMVLAERARAESKVAWMASFPERNPNPIVELELASGIIYYMNSSVERLFPDLRAFLTGLVHALLTAA